MKELKQRYLLSKKHFVLQDGKVQIHENSLFKEIEWEAKYSELGLDLVKYKNKEGLGNIVLFGCLSLASATLSIAGLQDGSKMSIVWVLAFISFLFATLLLWTLQNSFNASFILQGGNKTLEFFIDSPKESTVRSFIGRKRS